MNENDMILSRLDDYITSAIKTDRPVYTDFLNPMQQSMYIDLLDKSKDVIYYAFGGHENCERRIFCIISVFSKYKPDFEIINLIRIDFDKFNVKWITHRSILGAVLGLGNDRRMIGDIIIEGLSAFIFLKDNTADFVNQNLISIGRASVTTTLCLSSDLKLEIEQGTMKKSTVSSLRIDSVLASALNISRGKAVDLLMSDSVFVNWKLIKKATYILKQDDVISIRRRGRVILKSIGKKSAKDRTWIELECFI